MYRTAGTFCNTIYFKLSEHRHDAATTAVFKQAANANGFPNKVFMEKRGARYARIENISRLVMMAGLISFIEICQIKYLNNLIEQNYRFIEKIAKPMMRLKAFHSTQRQPLKPPYNPKGATFQWTIPAYQQLMALAG